MAEFIEEGDSHFIYLFFASCWRARLLLQYHTYYATAGKRWPLLGSVKLGHIEPLTAFSGLLDAPLVTLQNKNIFVISASFEVQQEYMMTSFLLKMTSSQEYVMTSFF